MDQKRPLAPTLAGTGTLSTYPDMLRALETLESVEYLYVAHGDVVDEGAATLVKLMADPDSATLIVNGCLFLNVGSFAYLDFERAEQDRWRFTLHGDGATLTLISIPETATEGASPAGPRLLSEDESGDFESLILLDDEDDED